jgi:hypothetical protein
MPNNELCFGFGMIAQLIDMADVVEIYAVVINGLRSKAALHCNPT